jgi:hypothetical protein
VRLNPAGVPGGPDGARVALVAALATLLVVVGWDFLAATTFFGDDHLFLTFARLAPHPFGPFIADHHGGEYYRPLPMASWWLLARLGGERAWVFALWGLLLHVTTAALTGGLARRLGMDGRAALLAAALFLAAPGPREAASWYSASTDLMATACVVGAVLCALRSTRGAQVGSLALAAAAYLSKESALVLPLLVAAGCWLVQGRPLPNPERDARPETPDSSPAPRATAIGTGPPSATRSLARALPHAALALLYLAARFAILRGAGGAGDQAAPPWARALQIGSGLVHALVGEHEAPQAVLWALGIAAIVWAACGVRRDRRMAFPALWSVLALAPLAAASWVVGARYFYLPAVGLAVLVARQLWARGPAVSLVAVGGLLALGSARAVERRAEIAQYQARVEAAAQAVSAGLAAGHRLFHVRGAVKDLDLILKERPSLRAQADDFLVLPDVPASFVLMPPALATPTHFLLADPPLPPSGAYRFGAGSVVGLARRHESPDLDDVVARLPELRFLRLFHDGAVVRWRDVTRPP